MIRKASKTGNWVLLKNVHLAPMWLVELEKDIYKMTLNENFRLFLTMENNPKVPSTLLRASNVLVFEPPSVSKLPWSAPTNRRSRKLAQTSHQYNAAKCTSLSPGLTLLSKSASATHQLAGPRSTHSTKLISVAPLTASMNGSTALVREPN